jgi:hypothetical protein
LAQSVSLESMRIAARRRAGQETLDQENAFATDAELDEELNAWLQHIYRLLVRARSGYYRAQQVITTSSGVSFYPLNLDFLEGISIDWVYGPTDICTIYPYEENERNMYVTRPGWLRNYPLMYQFQNQGINFIPAPQSAYTANVNYVPVFNRLKDPTDCFDGVAGFERFAVYKAASYLCKKDDNTEAAQMHEMDAAKIEQEVLAMAPNRTAGLRRVQRVRKARRWGTNYGG